LRQVLVLRQNIRAKCVVYACAVCSSSILVFYVVRQAQNIHTFSTSYFSTSTQPRSGGRGRGNFERIFLLLQQFSLYTLVYIVHKNAAAASSHHPRPALLIREMDLFPRSFPHPLIFCSLSLEIRLQLDIESRKDTLFSHRPSAVRRLSPYCLVIAMPCMLP
jgi:hypothetical protein